jgi:hypothetical protein
MSPENARDEVRRINEEIFKLILLGAADMLAAGAGISQVNAAIRANADQLASATSRSARYASSGLGQSPALRRLQDSQRNLLKSNVTRSSSVLQKATRFRHSLFRSSNPAATYNQIKRTGKLLMSNGAGAHYGEGVYVYGTEMSKIPSYIEVEVSSGVAVEELQVEGQGTFYRLVPGTGDGVPIIIRDTNIPEEDIKLMEKLLGTSE